MDRVQANGTGRGGEEDVGVNWTVIFNRLMEIMDIEGQTYFSGSRFIRKIQEVDRYVSSYSNYISERSNARKSTTRRDYFKDLLMGLDEGNRVWIVSSILAEVEPFQPELSSAIRKLLGGGTLAPIATIPAQAWNSARLNDYLGQIDGAIVSSDFERAGNAFVHLFGRISWCIHPGKGSARFISN